MRPLPSLRQLRYLLALAEHLNFTRAAQACFVTQSTLSAGLKELETLLGAQLVERDRQRVLMTPLGKQVASRARALVAAAEDLADLAREAAEPMAGSLRLGVIPTIAPFLLPTLLPALRARYPKLKPALREDLTANLLDRLASGHLDFAVIALPYDTAGLLVQPLFDDELRLVAPSGDPALNARRLTVSGDVAERLLLLEEGHCLREHTLAACSRSPAAADDLAATSLLTLVQMVESRLGIALVPEMALAAGLLDHSSLVAGALAEPAPKRTVALVARASTARRVEFDRLAELIVAGHPGKLGESKN